MPSLGSISFSVFLKDLLFFNADQVWSIMVVLNHFCFGNFKNYKYQHINIILSHEFMDFFLHVISVIDFFFTIKIYLFFFFAGHLFSFLFQIWYELSNFVPQTYWRRFSFVLVALFLSNKWFSPTWSFQLKVYSFSSLALLLQQFCTCQMHFVRTS